MKIKNLSPEELQGMTYKAFRKQQKQAVKTLMKASTDPNAPTDFILHNGFQFKGEKEGAEGDKKPMFIPGQQNSQWLKYSKELLKESPNAVALGNCYVAENAQAKELPTLHLAIEKGKAKPKAIAKNMAKFILKGIPMKVSVSNGEETAIEEAELEEEGAEEADNQADSPLGQAFELVFALAEELKKLKDPQAREALAKDLERKAQTTLAQYRAATEQVQALFAAQYSKLTNMLNQVLAYIQKLFTAKPSSTSLEASVGGAKAANQPQDVRLVQEVFCAMGHLKAATGVCDELTLKLILAVQKKMVEHGLLRKADGIIEPGGKTWQFLQAQQQKKQTASPQPRPSPTPTQEPSPASSAPLQPSEGRNDTNTQAYQGGKIKGGVGAGQENNENDVRIVQQLLAQKGHLSQAQITGKYDEATEKAILTVLGQFSRNSRPEISHKYKITIKYKRKDGSIDVYHYPTWDLLLKKIRITENQDTLGGAEDAVEQKLEDAIGMFTGVPIEVAKGQIVHVRLPYAIGGGIAATNWKKTKENPPLYDFVKSVIKVDNKGGTAMGKLSPPEAKKLLDGAIAKNLIPVKDRTSEGMRIWLESLGLGVDCNGLVAQVLNFMMDDDFDKNKNNLFNKHEFIGAGQYHKINAEFDLTPIPSANKLKAGHIMATSGHVLIIVDVDDVGEFIEFSTLEASSEGSTTQDQVATVGGIQQIRWRLPKKASDAKGKLGPWLKRQNEAGNFEGVSPSYQKSTFSAHKKVEKKLGREVG